ncbi:uncharacterized protein TNCV_3814741 [Trichonephila clavipes]|nr:uncharacterized protein TNCV_3814741 [Trichonephila clavipes]
MINFAVITSNGHALPLGTKKINLPIISQLKEITLKHGGGTIPELPINLEGYGSPVVKVSDHGRYVMSSSPVPLKTRREGNQCALNLSRAETSSRWCSVVVRRAGPAQVSSTPLDHGSKLRGPSPKALV